MANAGQQLLSTGLLLGLKARAFSLSRSGLTALFKLRSGPLLELLAASIRRLVPTDGTSTALLFHQPILGAGSISPASVFTRAVPAHRAAITGAGDGLSIRLAGVGRTETGAATVEPGRACIGRALGTASGPCNLGKA